MGQTEVAGNVDLRCSPSQQEWEMGLGLPATLIYAVHLVNKSGKWDRGCRQR